MAINGEWYKDRTIKISPKQHSYADSYKLRISRLLLIKDKEWLVYTYSYIHYKG